MKIELMKNADEFKQLQKGDLILVKWSDFFVKHTPKAKNVMFYNIAMNKTDENHTEIICQTKGNHYFNWDRYLQGFSNALEVYRVIVD